MRNWSYTIQEGEHKGKTLWSGRYCAVAAFVFKQENGHVYVLANRRGSGTPDFQGFWNCPCGFLEADETGEQGCARELLEETGLTVPAEDFIFVGVETDPKLCNNGNVSLLYLSLIDPANDTVSSSVGNLQGGEANEVSDIRWIPIGEIKDYQWAFNHEKHIVSILQNLSTLSSLCEKATN